MGRGATVHALSLSQSGVLTSVPPPRPGCPGEGGDVVETKKHHNLSICRLNRAILWSWIRQWLCHLRMPSADAVQPDTARTVRLPAQRHTQRTPAAQHQHPSSRIHQARRPATVFFFVGDKRAPVLWSDILGSHRQPRASSWWAACRAEERIISRDGDDAIWPQR
ncbi:hypothetical protein F5144DRAFT_75292 [Chaetomium tenue]|uniref:Uncharacterized protein n=1 Tax=Chaetomium tenue TaxID=1854479 RepID=A0ACB7PPS9_9PEZI|nr:hypothetical protein F5144DRAFT_75292 [Chaetomium globosum]